MIKAIIFASVLFCCSAAYSQESQAPMMVPSRTISTAPVKSYADSTEFAKNFKEFYPLIKPAKSVKEQATQYFQSISRAFAMQGIDTAEASKAAYKNLDEKAFEKIYFDTYRRNLTAKELKKYTEFLKTPEGKHIEEIWGNLQRVTSESSMYIARTMNLNLAPIRQAAREKMEREHPPEQGGQGMPPPLQQPLGGTPDVFDTRSAAGKDSLVRSQTYRKKLPPSVDSLATPKRQN